MKKVVIVSAVRTPVGSFGGSLKDTSPSDMGALVIKEALKRGKVDPKEVNEVFMGCVLQGGHGQGIARQCSIKAGIPAEVPATTINMICGSGLKTVSLAAQTILAGDNDVVVVGGTENMSQTPYLIKKARWGHKMGHGEITDYMINDGLTDVFNNYHMGVTAENLVEKYGITREEQDKLAAESQRRAAEARSEGRFKDEIVAVEIPQRKGDPIIFDTDEYIKEGSTFEKLSKLRPAFKKDGTVTAGNSSGINDAAAALVIMTEDKAKELGLEPLATIVSYASGGVQPEIMGVGPVPATKRALEKANLKIEDIDLIEANEAFAAKHYRLQGN